MAVLRGVSRLLSREGSVSDLVQWLSDLDASPWTGLLGVDVGQVDREVRLPEKAGNADLLIRDRDGVEQVLVEVKVAHRLSLDQRDRYTDWAVARGLRCVLAGLDDQRPSGDTRWEFRRLSEIVGAWNESQDQTARAVAIPASAALAGWEEMISGTFDGAASPALVSDADDVLLQRVLTRELARRLHRAEQSALAGVTSGGGNAIVQVWRPSQDGPSFIAELRFGPRLDVRFGVDAQDESPESRLRAYEFALSLGDALTVPALVKSLCDTGRSELATAITAPQGQVVGRPKPKGDWRAAILQSNATGCNPGFYRDGFYRLEALARVDRAATTWRGLEILLETALDHLEAAAQARTL